MSRIRKPIDKSRFAPIANALFEVGNKVGNAVWLFMWLVIRTTEEKLDEDGTRTGIVLGGDVLSDYDVSADITTTGYEISSETVRRWRVALCGAKKIRVTRRPLGYSYEVLDSRKNLPLRSTQNVAPVSAGDEQQRHNAAVARVQETAQQKADEEYFKKASQQEFAKQATKNFRALPNDKKQTVKDFVERCRSHWDYVRNHWANGDSEISETPIPKDERTLPNFPKPTAHQKLRMLELADENNWEPIFHQWKEFCQRPQGFDDANYIWALFFSETKSINSNRAWKQETEYQAERQNEEKEYQEHQDELYRQGTLKRLERERATASA